MTCDGLLLICSFTKAYQMLRDAANAHGFAPVYCSTLSDARAAIARQDLAAIICAGQVLDGGYQDLLRWLASTRRLLPVFVVLADYGHEREAEARELGAAGCMPRPTTSEDVGVLIRAVRQHLSEAPKKGSHKADYAAH